MSTYIYQAALYCQPCGLEIIKDCMERGIAPDCASCELNYLAHVNNGDIECNKYDPGDDSNWDSAEFPKGPFGDGGGEADSPQYCDNCDLFLDNPLTEDGLNYVKEMIIDNISDGFGSIEVLKEWIDFYDLTLKDFQK